MKTTKETGTIPDQLKSWRSLRKLSQPEAAASLGVTVSALRKWEQGQRTISQLAWEGLQGRMRGVPIPSYMVPEGVPTTSLEPAA